MKAPIPSSEFKAHCLKLLDDVEKHGSEYVVTKRGRPVARVVPIAVAKRASIFGSMAGSMEIAGDIISPIGEQWDAEQ